MTIVLLVPIFSESHLGLLNIELHSRHIMSGFIEAEAWTVVGGRTASQALSPTHCSSCHRDEPPRLPLQKKEVSRRNLHSETQLLWELELLKFTASGDAFWHKWCLTHRPNQKCIHA